MLDGRGRRQTRGGGEPVSTERGTNVSVRVQPRLAALKKGGSLQLRYSKLAKVASALYCRLSDVVYTRRLLLRTISAPSQRHLQVQRKDKSNFPGEKRCRGARLDRTSA